MESVWTDRGRSSGLGGTGGTGGLGEAIVVDEAKVRGHLDGFVLSTVAADLNLLLVIALSSD